MVKSSACKRRRADCRARSIEGIGATGHAIKKSASGAPTWPIGVVGSLAHDAEIAVAAVAIRREFSSVGIDVEPASALDPDVLDLVATETERMEIQDDLFLGRVLFTIKEAVYKAVFPLDGEFLDHHDVEVKFAKATAVTRGGRTVTFRYCAASHIVTLAFIQSAKHQRPTMDAR